MTTVTFYFNVKQREAALCQLVEKALKQKLRIHILTENEAESVKLDRYLWQLPSIGFLPHCAADHPLANDTPILIDHRHTLLTSADILFNWCSGIPQSIEAYQRIIEIVDSNEGSRDVARQRFRDYQAQNINPQTIDLAVTH